MTHITFRQLAVLSSIAQDYANRGATARGNGRLEILFTLGIKDTESNLQKLSRTLSQLVKNGLVRRENGFYYLTECGKTLCGAFQNHTTCTEAWEWDD